VAPGAFGANRFLVTVHDAQGRPVSDAQVQVIMTMLGMAMGSQDLVAQPAGGGRYQAVGLLSMPGGWQITARVQSRTLRGGTIQSSRRLNAGTAQQSLLAALPLLGAAIPTKSTGMLMASGTSAAQTALLQYPNSMAVDPDGTIYLVDAYDGQVLKEARDSSGGYQQRVIARGLTRPAAVAVTGTGVVYIADTGNDRIIQETPDRAGQYRQHILFSKLLDPLGLAVTGSGVIDIADTGHGRLLEETPGGGDRYTGTAIGALGPLFGVAAGKGNAICAVDTAVNLLFCLPASPTTGQVQVIGTGLQHPTSVAVAMSGTVFLTDSGQHRVLMETPTGHGHYRQTRVAGTLDDPEAVAVDGRGRLYILTPSGIYLSAAGAPPILVVPILNDPQAVAVDQQGTVYIADTGNNRVIKEVRDRSGGYSAGVLGYGLSGPEGVAVDSKGTVSIADTNNDRVVQEIPVGHCYRQRVLASGLNTPEGVAAGPDGSVVIADSGNDRVVAETRVDGRYTQGVVATLLNGPHGVALDSRGDIFIADTEDDRVVEAERRHSGSYLLSTVIDGIPDVQGLGVSGSGVLYIVDTDGNRIIQAVRKGAGRYSQRSVVTGLATPYAVAVDAGGMLSVADTGSNQVLNVRPGGIAQEVVASGLGNAYGVAVQGNGVILPAQP
jgi:serine/threonine-protein kinase